MLLETRTASGSVNPSDVLILDDHTFRDLEVFDSDTAGTSLFEFCNLTRIKGGATALRRRMQRPWSNADRIRATQDSLSFIIAQRQAFEKLQSLAYAASRVERYTHDALQVITHKSALAFGFDVFALRANDDRSYSAIAHGVQITRALIRALRRFVDQVELESAAGELAPLLEEIRDLLSRRRLSLICHDKPASRAWRILRTDQDFRLYEKQAISRLLGIIYEMDALVALADVTCKHDFVLPLIEAGPLSVVAEDLVHPLVQHAIANPVRLDQQRRLLFLTGPNMAGKTTYLRAFATALYFAHLGMGVPARSFRFVPAERLFSSISLNDNLLAGISYFRAEALRVKAIAQAIAEGHRVVALMDEPFKGTNIKDAFDASLAILARFAVREDCLFMFSSHLIELSEPLSSIGTIDCRNFEAEEGEGRLRFRYLLRPGVSSQRLGMRVLREEGIFDLLDGNL